MNTLYPIRKGKVEETSSCPYISMNTSLDSRLKNLKIQKTENDKRVGTDATVFTLQIHIGYDAL